MNRLLPALVLGSLLLASATAQAGIATYDDFNPYVIRNNVGQTATIVPNDLAQTFTVTALNSGKVAMGTSAINGAKVSDFLSLSFRNSREVGPGQITYMNFWVTDGNANHYALISVNSITGTTQDDYPVYQRATSTGIDAAYFNSLAVRVYPTSYTDVAWLYPGAVRMSKGGGWPQSLWKSGTALIDPVLLSDLGNLYFGSPFTSTTTPGVAGNSQWPSVGTGDPQTPDSFYLVCGDTSGSVTAPGYTLSDITLEWASAAAVPEPSSLALCSVSLLGLVGLGLGRMRKRAAA